MKLSTVIIIILSGSLFIVSLLFCLIAIDLKKSKNKCKLDMNNCTNNNMNNCTNNSTNNSTNNIDNYKDNYDVFENIDLLNKFDILDNFNDRINIYSFDLDNCFNICESTNSCLGFIRFHNYCYLKNNSNIEDQTTSKDMNLFYRKSILPVN